MDDRQLVRSLGGVGPIFFRGFDELRPSQRAAIPAVLKGLNVLLACPTASGKTEAVFAPLIASVLSRGSLRVDGGVRILAIAPTRALVNDLHARLSPLLEELGLSCGRQTSDHHTGRHLPFLLITTPESFDSLLARRAHYDGNGRLESHALAQVEAVFIDEVHLFSDSARGDQLLWLLARLRRIRRLRPDAEDRPTELHICAASATVSDPHQLADRVLGAGSQVLVVPGGRELVVHSVAGDGGWWPVSRATTASDLVQAVFLLNAADSLPEVADRIWAAMSEPHIGKPIRKVLVFVPSRGLCDELSALLDVRLQRERAVSVFAHHGSLDRSVREDSERRFGRERDAVLVATSTLEVGVDIGDVDAVVLVGPPPTTNGLLQRIGRSGRREGVTRVVAIARWRFERLALASMLLAARDGVCDPSQYGRRWSVCVQQTASFVYQGPPRGRRRDDLTELAKDVWDEEGSRTCDEVVNHLLTLECLDTSHGGRVRLGSKWQDVWDGMGMHGNIDSAGQGTPVVNAVTGEIIAHIPRGSRIQEQISIAGQNWHVRVESGEVLLESTRSKRPAGGVRYSAKSAPMGYPLARHVAIGLGLSDRSLLTMEHATRPYVLHFGGHLLERVLKALAPHFRSVPMLAGIALEGHLDGPTLAAWQATDRVRQAWTAVIDSSSQALGVGPYHGQLPVEVQRKTCEELFPLSQVMDWFKRRQLTPFESLAGEQAVIREFVDEATSH